MKNNLFRRACGSSILSLAAVLVSAASEPVFAQEAGEEAVAEAASSDLAQSGIAAWGIGAEIKADDTVVYGVLGNGMRYALKRNTQPEGEASLRLLFDVGTRDEADDEEGAAHFVEHMAFNGSTNIPEGELVPRLERLGLAFGADTNAETYPHYTMYKLDLPNLEDETVSASFEILREMASELTISPEAVEAEKGIILSEFQVRNSPERRRSVDFLNDIMATSRIADRAVAEPEATRSLTAPILRGFYEGYYRPEKATLVIVGDFDVGAMEQRIAEVFSSWQGTGEARERFVPQIAEFDGLKTSVFVDPAANETIELHRVTNFTPASNSVEEFRTDLLDLVAVIAMRTRIATLSRAEDASFFNGGIGAQGLFQSAQLHLMVINAKDGQWRGAVQAAEQEWRRMAQFGVTKSELEQAKTSLESSLATAVAQSNSSTSAGLASALAMSSLENTVYQSPEQQLAVYRQIADTITPEAVQANFVAKWGEGPEYVQVASKTAVEGGEQAVAAALAESRQVALSAPEEAEAVEFAYTDFGAAGSVVSDDMIDDLGIRTIAFANGVRLNLKKTDFEPGKIVVRAEIGTGLSTVADKPGLQLLAIVTNSGDDLGQHTSVELRQLLAGKQVAYGYSLDEDAVALASATTPDDLLLQLQVMAAQVTDTAFSAQSQRRWAAAVPVIAGNITASPQTVHGIAFESILANDDPRLGFVDPEVMASLSMDDLKAVVGGQFASGAINIGLVGDLDEDAAIAAVAQTLGALDRPEVEPVEARPLILTENRDVRVLNHAGQADQGMISLSWPTTDGSDDRSTLTRLLLAELIKLEALRVLREELGATYTPSTLSSASSTYEGFGHISMIAPAEPGAMDEVSKVVRELVAGLVTTAPTADAMQRARKPLLESFERDDTSNSGWAGYVTEAQSHPEGLDYRRNRSELLASITPEEILAAAQQYLTGQPIEIRAIPAPANAVTQ